MLNDETIELNEGDILFFDGSTPHALQNKHTETVTLLKMYMIQKNTY